MRNRNYMGLMMLMVVPVIHSCHSSNGKHDWSVAFSLPADTAGNDHLGLAGPVAGVHSDVLFVGGGANFPNGTPWRGNEKAYGQTLYAYQQDNSGQVRLVSTATLPLAWAYGASCSTPQGLVVAGGENADGLLNRAMLIAWDGENKTPTFKRLPDLPAAVTNASMAALGSLLYLAGGETESTVSGELLTLDLLHPDRGWQKRGALPYPVSHACLIAQQNALYLMGGRKRNPGGVSDFYDGVWRYDMVTGDWTAKTPLPKPLSAAAAFAADHDDILFIGGDDGGTFLQVEAAIAAISKETNPRQLAALNEQKITLLENHPGFEGTVLRYHTDDDTWHHDGEIQLPAPVTTTAAWWQGNLYLPSGEIRAGVRSPDVLVRSGSNTPATQQTK